MAFLSLILASPLAGLTPSCSLKGGVGLFASQIDEHVRWLIFHSDSDARVYVYTRSDRDAMIAEGQRQGINGLCWRWNIGRRGWEFTVLA